MCSKRRQTFFTLPIRVLWIIICLLSIVVLYYSQSSSPEVIDEEVFLGCHKLCPYVGRFTRHRLTFDSDYSIDHHPDFICPSNFRNLADWIYGSDKDYEQRIEVTTRNGQFIASCLPTGSIIYVSRSLLERFFEEIYPHFIHPFVLITGGGDEPSPPNMIYLERNDSKIIHWFGQNGQIESSESKKFTHIPIGINCHEMAEAIYGVHQRQFKNALPSVYGDADEPSHYIQPLDVTYQVLNNTTDAQKLLLINFDLTTDPTLNRRRVWNDMCPLKNKLAFVTCLTKSRGVRISSLPDIYARNRHYFFWLSPRGNGIDCHRTWEALYLDVIPIVWNSTINSLYKNLPVLVINSHLEITENFLRTKLKEISKKKYYQTTKMYRFEKLRLAYWRRLILSQSRHASGNPTIRRGLCWRATTKL